MDQEEYLKKLSEVSKWRPATLVTAGPGRPSDRRYKKTKQHTLDSIEEDEEEIEEDINEDAPLADLGPEIVELKCQAQICEDCGIVCPNGRKKELKLYTVNKRPHWRHGCVTCDRAYNPYTGKYDIPINQQGNVWLAFIKQGGKLGRKMPASLERIRLPTGGETIYESDTEIIKSYPDSDTER